ncbi:CDK5 and ABL1 enzyme substrate 2-like [Astyanax mexicanus]|uniref:CDK5 and ABL1 enzyme substrate 2-like n=1 Tax=Astyanax mexicanus TaxID=7994 RepID=UPI0020CB4B0F|nr:CDK5 and ABL1 enzyme substrate 2-like [Astyanax mexicanus]
MEPVQIQHRRRPRKTQPRTPRKSSSAEAGEESGGLMDEAAIPGCSSVPQCSGALRQTSHNACMEIGPSRDFAVEMQRCSAGSPEPKSCKKVHFIKNMRQHDTRNGRI